MSELIRTVPEKVGVSSRVLVEMYEELKKNALPIHSMILMRHGKIVTNGYWYPYRKDMNHIIYSTSKSITALAVGLCIEEGRFGLEDRLVDFFPELITGPVHEFTGMRTIRHLLTMTDGQLGDPNHSIDRDYCDWFKAYLNSIPRVRPGTLYGYNNAATIGLCAVIQKVTGMTMMEYLQPRLFDPLGIHDIYCEEQMGINTGSRGIHCKTEDLAKIGQLMLQKGRWEGRQIIPEWWVAACTANHVPVTNFSIVTDDNPGYGYQWWLYRDGAIGTKGNGGQNVIYYPKYDIVWAMTANMEDCYGSHPELVHTLWPYILRSVTEDVPEEDPESYEKLLEIEKGLQFAVPEGLPGRGSQEEYLSGKKYIMARNTAQFNDFVITQTGKGLEFAFSFGEDREVWRFEAGLNHWLGVQPLTITNDAGWAKYTWLNENVLQCIVLLKEQLGSYRLFFYFDKDEASLDFFPIGWRDFKRFYVAGMAYHHGE